MACRTSRYPHTSVRLVEAGLFPTAPSDPRVAISIDLLEFYSKLFERGGTAVTAFTGAMRDFYTSQGCMMINEKVRSTFFLRC